ncbi:hypothetical protein [Burkholderia sp. 22313]|uniref:hypothetical protein n=1 Tax=Burkholderia sp. 22313 TaxID=3453908 RepID=UPI002BFA787F|nr:hypothetical protein [Burkholderia sp.]
MMTDTERDILYTDLCRRMTRVGEADASLFLARFAHRQASPHFLTNSFRRTSSWVDESPGKTR